MSLKRIYCTHEFNKRYLKIDTHASLSHNQIFMKLEFHFKYNIYE